MNDLTISDIHAYANSVLAQVTGVSPGEAWNTNLISTVAQVGLKCGYDNFANAIGQVLSDTVFVLRSYERKFKNIQADALRYGNHVRKIQTYGTTPVVTNEEFDLTCGESIDMYKVQCPNLLQTNFYGQATYMLKITVFKNQLDTAFQNGYELGMLFALLMQQLMDDIEQVQETLARSILVNLATGMTLSNPGSVIHLLTLYNEWSGLNLTAADVNKPGNYEGFIRWAAGKIESIQNMMNERNTNWHASITGKPILRHTPRNRMNSFILAPELYNITSNVLSTTFHDNLIKFPGGERVNYWQNQNSPYAMNAVPSYMKADGTIGVAEESVNLPQVFAVLTDYEALGYTVINHWSSATPMNSAGGYHNIFFHFTDRYWNDFTENAVVFTLD